MLAGGVRGQAELRHVRKVLTASPAQMRKNMAAGTRKALAPLKQEIPAAAGRLPSGYAPLMAKAVKVAISVRGSVEIRATVDVSAKGRRESRDVRARDAGFMRHPVFGRFRRLKSGRVMANPWVVQKVRPGFVSEPVAKAKVRVVEAVRQARDEVANEIVRG